MSGDQPGTGEPDGEADPAADAAGGVTVEELRSGCPLLFADHIFSFFHGNLCLERHGGASVVKSETGYGKRNF